MVRLLVCLLLVLVPAVHASQLVISWDPPVSTPSGVTITGYQVAGCLVASGSTTCTPLDLPLGGIGPTVRSFTDTSVAGGGRYCYAVVTLATGAKQSRSAPSSPVVCAVAPLDLPSTPGLAQRLQATIEQDQVRLTWEPPVAQAGVTMTGYVVTGCVVPPGATTCAPPTGPLNQGMPASVQTYLHTAVTMGNRYCYAVVSWGTGAQKNNSAPTTPPVCVALAGPVPDAPQSPQNVRATVPVP